MQRLHEVGPAVPAPPVPPGSPTGRQSGAPTWRDSVGGLAVRILLLGLVAAIAVWAAFPLIHSGAWVGLGILVATTLGLFYIYLTPRHVPAKYLVPGTLFLIAFQILPVLYTASTAFSNFGDGHRGSKQDAIVSIQTASVVAVPGSVEYSLSIATTGDPATGPLVFLVTDPTTRQAFAGDATGLDPLPSGSTTVNSSGKITQAAGYTILNAGQASARSAEITGFTVPTPAGAIRSNGLSRAYEGKAVRHYETGCDCVTDTQTGHVWTAANGSGSFVDTDSDRLPQGWRVGVGFHNFATVLTNPAVAKPFLGTLLWNLAFAIGSVLVTFTLGVLCALALDTERLRGKAWYRTLLVLPYAMPSFAMLLVWRDMFNTDFGLINKLFGLHVDWLGGAWSARVAVILVQLWLGYPYMFLVSTGALQAIPKEMNEAAEMDGATPWQRFRRVTLPLLMVALAPLLIASFAFNFNNFNAIYLTTEGGPFPADNSTVGATDLLITYTYRVAFGAAGAQYGLAAAISLFIFLIVATISAISFRRTRLQEEVYG